MYGLENRRIVCLYNKNIGLLSYNEVYSLCILDKFFQPFFYQCNSCFVPQLQREFLFIQVLKIFAHFLGFCEEAETLK